MSNPNYHYFGLIEIENRIEKYRTAIFVKFNKENLYLISAERLPKNFDICEDPLPCYENLFVTQTHLIRRLYETA